MAVREPALPYMKTYYKAIKIKYLVLDHEQRDRSIECHRQSINRHANSYTEEFSI